MDKSRLLVGVTISYSVIAIISTIVMTLMTLSNTYTIPTYIIILTLFSPFIISAIFLLIALFIIFYMPSKPQKMVEAKKYDDVI